MERRQVLIQVEQGKYFMYGGNVCPFANCYVRKTWETRLTMYHDESIYILHMATKCEYRQTPDLFFPKSPLSVGRIP